MKRVFVKIAALVAVLSVLVAALAVGIIHSVSTHAASATTSRFYTVSAAAAAYTEPCPATQTEGKSSGVWVQAVQFFLNELHSVDEISFAHYPLATDGIFGPNTKGAVVAWQSKFMKPDPANGIVNAQTWASLGFCTPVKWDGYLLLTHTDAAGGTHCPGQLASGSSGTWVQALQQMLNIDANAGYIAKSNWWPLARDGKFGANTVKAAKSLQARNKLKQDGIVGSQSWGAMGMCY